MFFGATGRRIFYYVFGHNMTSAISHSAAANFFVFLFVSNHNLLCFFLIVTATFLFNTNYNLLLFFFLNWKKLS